MRHLTVDSRLLGAALLAAVAAASVLIATRPPPTTPVLVLEAPAAAGTRVVDMDLVERPVLDGEGLVLASQRAELSDAVLLIDAPAGVPLLHAAIRSGGGTTPAVIGLELDAAAAVHGVLVAGDRVDVHHAAQGGDVLATEVPVVGVIADEGTLGSGHVGVLLAVDRDLASSLIDALHGAGVHLVRSGR